MIDIHKAKRCA